MAGERWDLRHLSHLGPPDTILKMRIAVVIGMIFILGASRARARQEPPAVQAKKGPVQITFRLQKTTVRVKRSLWYKIDLKNVGKENIGIEDRVFRDPYEMHHNSRTKFGLYLEILDSKGKPLKVKMGDYRAKYDWEPAGDDYYRFSAKEKKEIMALQDKWKKSGMSEQEQSIAYDGWIRDLKNKKNEAELRDPAHQHWLAPGASTATFAWSDRGPGDYPGRSEDDESLSQGYTELWEYRLLRPGKYRIRAVYNYDQPGETRALFAKHGHTLPSWWVRTDSPFIDFEVVP